MTTKRSTLLASLAAFIGISASAATYTAPYTQTFDAASSISDFTVLDANGDGKTFRYAQLYDAENDSYDGYLQNAGQAGGTDDWVFTPGIMLEAGKYYDVSVDVRSWSDKWEETFEIWIGTAKDPLQLTDLIYGGTTKKNYYQPYRNGFVAATSGYYYVAIHSCNPGDSFHLMVDNIKVSAGVTAERPGQPEYFTLTPSPTGALSATISFKAPATTINGKALTSLTKCEIYRDDQLITTISNPTPGATVSYTDTGMEAGYHTYSACAYNAAGQGASIEERRYIGVNLPAPVLSCKVVETSTPGVVTATWVPSNKDIDGYDLDNSLLSYVIARVVNGEIVTVASRVKGTSYTFNGMTGTDPQELVYLGVYAYTSAGMSATAPAAPSIMIGTPYELPFIESYANAEPSYTFASARTAGNSPYWAIIEDGATDLVSHDNDGGLVAMKGGYINDASKLMLGKMNLDCNEPELSFWYYSYINPGNEANRLNVNIVDSNNATHTVATIEMNGGVNQWQQAFVSLADYAHQTVAVELEAVVVNRVYTVLDDIRILGEEASVEAIEADLTPSIMIAGRNISAINTSDIIEAYSIDGRLVASGRGSLTLPSEGLYIVKCAGMTHKIAIN